MDAAVTVIQYMQVAGNLDALGQLQFCEQDEPFPLPPLQPPLPQLVSKHKWQSMLSQQKKLSTLLAAFCMQLKQVTPHVTIRKNSEDQGRGQVPAGLPSPSEPYIL